MKKSLVVSLLVLFSVYANCKEAILKFDLSGSSNWSPYYFHDKSNPGILGELVPEILAQANIKGEHVILPAARLNAALEKGDVDFDLISPAWFGNHEFAPKFVLSDPVIQIKEYIVQLRTHPSLLSHEKEIHDKLIGTVRGYYYHNDDTFHRVDFSSEKELIKALARKRIDYAIIGDLPAIYWAKRLGVNIKMSLLHSEGYLHIRLRNEHAALLSRINSAIFKLKQTNRLQTVTDKYISQL